MNMEMFEKFLYALLCVLSITTLVHAQSQSGFISIDCGIPENSSYNDETTGLFYVSDSGFIDNNTGKTSSISIKHLSSSLDQQLRTVRSFPDDERNCYTLNPADGKGAKYLIRAWFMYGDYDEKNSVPQFDIFIGANKWGAVKLVNTSSITTMEIIYNLVSDSVFLCLVNTGHGTPFISALELRPLRNSTYADSGAATLFRRLDIGSQSSKPIRYKDDVYDRIWQPFNFPNRRVLKTNLTVDSETKNAYQIPSLVMSTAMAPENATGRFFTFEMKPEGPTAEYNVYMHFAEVEVLGSSQSREFFIFENAKLWIQEPVSLDYLSTKTYTRPEPTKPEDETIRFDLLQSTQSTHQPIINALEVYLVQNFSEPQTNELDDVKELVSTESEAMMKIKSDFGVRKNWQGDPCSPKTYMWNGLNCSFNGQDPVRVVSLNLSLSALTGKISPHISDLTMIQSLDLSNNSLTGSVPEFLSKLQSLSVLDLSGNKLSGSVPPELIEKSNSGSLLLSLSGNPDLCMSLSCQNTKKNKQRYIVPVIASVASVLVVLVALAVWFKFFKTRKRVVAVETERNPNTTQSTARIGSEMIEEKKYQYTYLDIVEMTNNFEKEIGKGGFGIVYYGYINEIQVAVKILSESSKQGNNEFQAEVKLLMRVHHKNLTNFIGYCKEDKFSGLIYEYMSNGNLDQHISAKSVNTLNWDERMRIAVESAQGLEYLHHGCKPPIVHRDIKPGNILLNRNFHAKIADFGLSRDSPADGGTQTTTDIAGTRGYLDPECLETNRLNEKSDVYSFGIVLLQMITGRKVYVKISEYESLHIPKWVAGGIDNGEIDDIVDPRLKGGFRDGSAWKAVEIAMACVRTRSLDRPTMSQVVIDLNECLDIVSGSKKHDDSQGSQNMDFNLDSEINPSSR